MGGGERAGLQKTSTRSFFALSLPFERSLSRPNCPFFTVHWHAAVSMRRDSPVGALGRGRSRQDGGEREDNLFRGSCFFDHQRERGRERERNSCSSLDNHSPPHSPAAAPRGAFPSPPRRPRATYRGQASGTEGESHCEVSFGKVLGGDKGGGGEF